VPLYGRIRSLAYDALVHGYYYMSQAQGAHSQMRQQGSKKKNQLEKSARKADAVDKMMVPARGVEPPTFALQVLNRLFMEVFCCPFMSRNL